MELRQIQYFIAIAELEHFGRASQRLRIAQPALSRQVKLLEEELGVELFERLPRGVRLSEAGRVFLERTREIARQLDHAVIEARAAADGQGGVLHLGVIEVAAWQGLVPEAIRLFRDRHPEVRLALSAFSGQEQIEALMLNQLDAGLLYYAPNDPALQVTPLQRNPVMLAVNARLPLAQRTSVRLADLEGVDLISFRRTESPRLHDDIFAGFARAGFVPHIVTEARREADILALVSSGAGVALVNSNQRFRPPHEVRFLEVEDLGVDLTLNYVHRRDQRKPLILRFAEILEELA